MRVRPAIKEDGTENTYLKGRLATLDEDRVGDVLYCRPSASTLHLRLPFEEVQGNRFAQRIGSQQSAEKFARVKH